MGNVVVEGWFPGKGWGPGGVFDLKDAGQKKQARERVREMETKCHGVRCRMLYNGGEVDIFSEE